MSELDSVFEELKKAKLCKSQHRFSCEFLGRAPNYFSALRCMQNKGKSIQPSTHVLMVLHLKLTELVRRTNEPNDFDSYHAKQNLITLSNSVLATIKKRCS